MEPYKVQHSQSTKLETVDAFAQERLANWSTKSRQARLKEREQQHVEVLAPRPQQDGHVITFKQI